MILFRLKIVLPTLLFHFHHLGVMMSPDYKRDFKLAVELKY